MASEFQGVEFATGRQVAVCVQRQKYRCPVCAQRLELGAAVLGFVAAPMDVHAGRPAKVTTCAMHAECVRASDAMFQADHVHKWARELYPDTAEGQDYTLKLALGWVKD